MVIHQVVELVSIDVGCLLLELAMSLCLQTLYIGIQEHRGCLDHSKLCWVG